MQIQDALAGTDRGGKVIVIKPGATIADMVDLLVEYKIGAVVVSKDGAKIDGIISERDLVYYLAHEQEGTLRLKVEDLMTENVTTCKFTDKIDEVMAVMVAGHFRHMPVVNDDESLAGIVSLGDLVNSRLGELERQNEALRAETSD